MPLYSISAGNAPVELICNGVTVRNFGPSTVFYSDSQNINIDGFEGAIVSGGSAALEGAQFFIVGSARATIDVPPPAAAAASGGIAPDQLLPYTRPGVLAVESGSARLRFPTAVTIVSVAAAVNTAPTGASIVTDVNKNGTTIFTNQANRPTVSAAGFASTDQIPDITSVSAGDYLTVDIDQVGSTVAGADLSLVVRYHG